MTKICICFFGVISRSLKYTIDSIKENIFDVLKESNIDYDIYVHNMKVSNFISIRAGDSNNNLKECCDLLNYDFFKETLQEDFDKKYNILFEKCKKYGIHPSYKYNTVKNAIRQLYSIKQVTNMWKNNKNIKYDYFIYLRPDLLYINKINIKQILYYIKQDKTLLTPYWHKFNGLNDRIYMGTNKTIHLFGNRFDELEKMIAEIKNIYIPENFMKYIANKYNIKIINIDLKGKRVRTNGKILNEKF